MALLPGLRSACLLRHRGHGPTHLDLVLADGAACPTLRLDGRRWRWQPPHRRRYLGWAGPIAGGRGSIRIIWRGQARIRRHNLGWIIALADWTLLLRRDGVVLPLGVTHCRPCSWRIPG